MANFYIRFLKRKNETQIGWLSGTRNYFLYADTVKEEVRDRRIVSVLRKYLDMEFESGQLVIFNRKDFEALGELLFDLIFTDENLFTEFNEWYNGALRDDEGAEAYNIFLEFEQDKAFDDLAVLPWEYIHFRPREEGRIHEEPFLAASTTKKINFYRKVPFTFVDAHNEQFFTLEPPLKILLLISETTQMPLVKKKDLLHYFKKLKETYPDDSVLQIKYLYQPSPNTDEFKQELNSGQLNKSESYSLQEYLGEKIGKHSKSFSPDIIHYVGHGFVKDNNGMLVFAEEEESKGGYFANKPVNDTRFSNTIKNSRLNPKLVFLQVCNGGRIVDYINNKGIAICLLEKHVPFVIAMQNPIQEDHALRFTKSFYNNFMRGKNIGSCVSIGRYEMGGQGEFNHKAFGSPVLFTFTSFPLWFNSLGEGNKKEIAKHELEEEIIKYCNFPGCPHYGDVQKYSPTDIMCTQGHRLVGRKKEVGPDEAEIKAARQINTAPKTLYENKMNNISFMSETTSRTSSLHPNDSGNGDSFRKPSNWNDD